MKKIKKISKIFFIVLCILFSITIISSVSYYHIATYGVSLDREKLESSKSMPLKIIDIDGNSIMPTNQNFISIQNLKPHTKNAFIAAEDKRFYSHNGIDYIRIGGALISNIKSKSFSEGASTISQQLIKNTMLSNEKTINRKLKEFKLARKLEKEYSKNDILEMYLNNIYFGSGAYGIENASNHYFGKSASNLSLSESALLAGTINAPSLYSIQNNLDKALERRNLILNLMLNQNKITKEEFNKAISEIPTLSKSKTYNSNELFNEIIEEACSILNINENELKSKNLEIHTNYNSSLTNTINQQIKNNFSEVSNYNVCGIILDNKTKTIQGIFGDSKLINQNNQPGSIIKPILVYAPAIENNIITPETKLLDEEINISGYSPKNADNKYHGYVSAKECLKNSYNIPAVKLLNEIGTTKAIDFAKNLGLTFSEKDNHLAIALGGLTDGLTLKQIADAYSAFATNGKFAKSTYITKIKKNNKVIYEKKTNLKNTMKDSTANLINEMLIETSKSGTAKKLSNLKFQIASKTGTVGKIDSNKNKCAYCVSYTTNHLVITLITDSNLPESINGSTYPTLINKCVLNELYKSKPPKDFPKTKLPQTENQSFNPLQKNNQAEEIKKQEIISNQDKNKFLNTHLEVFNFENRKPILCFFTSNQYTYNIIRKDEKKEEIISSFSPKNDLKITKYEDISAKSSEIYEYFVEICEKSNNQKHFTNKVKLKSF